MKKENDEKNTPVNMAMFDRSPTRRYSQHQTRLSKFLMNFGQQSVVRLRT